MIPFSIVGPIIGGVLLGLAASLLYVAHGRIAGISGIIAGLFAPKADDLPFRVSFLLGLFVAGTAASALLGHATAPLSATSFPVLIVAGLFVGFGARLGGGCTSGHGVCGVSRLSPRSIVATTLFIFAGATVVYVVRHVLGGAS